MSKRRATSPCTRNSRAQHCPPVDEARRKIWPADQSRLQNYYDVVADYRRGRPNGDPEWAWYETLQVEVAVRNAGLATTECGKRHAHQRRLPKALLDIAGSRLEELQFRRQEQLTFDALHTSITTRVGSLKGIGPLYCYDTAMRIGAALRVFPDRIYLHSGTLKGARALVDTKGKTSISIDQLPAPFRRLTARELEDVLCIYADAIHRIAARLGN